MHTLTLPIVIGNKYKRRDGKIVTVRAPLNEFSPDWAYVGSDEFCPDEDQHVFLKTGRVRHPGLKQECPADLVADAALYSNLNRKVKHTVLGTGTIYFMSAAPRSIHDYAHILHAIADGKVIQLDVSDDEPQWEDVNVNRLLKAIATGQARTPAMYRVKPDTITVNGIEVPEPLRIAPADGTLYWIADTSAPLDDLTSWSWDNSGPLDRLALQRGLAHISKENAIAHIKALIAPSTLPE